jgi:hypothetical protein
MVFWSFRGFLQEAWAVVLLVVVVFLAAAAGSLCLVLLCLDAFVIIFQCFCICLFFRLWRLLDLRSS